VIPAVPQCWVLLVWHVLFWQQPFAQLAGVQTHEPFWQVSFVPHRVPHAPQLFASVWVLVHAPSGAVPQQVAAGAVHAAPLPHRH
jgi:hypothetical protein